MVSNDTAPNSNPVTNHPNLGIDTQYTLTPIPFIPKNRIPTKTTLFHL